MRQATTNKYQFQIRDGGGTIQSVISDDVASGNVEELCVVVDNVTAIMYIDGVAQADVETLDSVAPYYDEGNIKSGVPGQAFEGSIFEIAVDAEVITP